MRDPLKFFHVLALFLTFKITQVVSTSILPQKGLYLVTITDEVETGEALVERILTLADVGFNVIVLGYGIDSPSIVQLKDAVYYWNELTKNQRSLVKEYTKSRGVYLLLAIGGPQTDFERLIRSSAGMQWGSTLMFDSLLKAYDGIFIDFYFNPNSLCEETVKKDSCLCQVPSEGGVDDTSTCAINCGIGLCDDIKKCRPNAESRWTTFMEDVLTTASGIVSSDDMIGYGLPASMFQYIPSKPNGLGWKVSTYERSSLLLPETYSYNCFQNSNNCEECDISESETTGLKHTVCTKVASANHALPRDRDTGHYADFVVPRYFTEGECRDNTRDPYKVVYNTKEKIYVENNEVSNFNEYQYQSLGSNVHSMTYKNGYAGDRIAQQYDKSRIVPGFDFRSEKIGENGRLDFDKLTNWSCEYTVIDQSLGSYWGSQVDDKLLFNPNLWKGNWAIFGDRENLTEKYKLFFNKTESSCLLQLNGTVFPVDFIESSGFKIGFNRNLVQAVFVSIVLLFPLRS